MILFSPIESLQAARFRSLWKTGLYCFGNTVPLGQYRTVSSSFIFPFSSQPQALCLSCISLGCRPFGSPEQTRFNRIMAKNTGFLPSSFRRFDKFSSPVFRDIREKRRLNT
jgi:hypothetical protein